MTSALLAQGWLLALALGACGGAMAILHHQLFFVGMRNGGKPGERNSDCLGCG